MIKDAYLKESTIPEDEEDADKKKKMRSPFITFADFDERKMLNASRLGMYFRQSLVGMVAYQQHGNVLENDFEMSDQYDEDQDQIYVENH
jgi:hypothetical protein